MRFWPDCTCCGGGNIEVAGCDINFPSASDTITLDISGGGDGADDLYIAIIYYRDANLTTVPTGWVELHSGISGPPGGELQWWLGYRKPDPGETIGWNWVFDTPTPTARFGGVLTYLINADEPFDSTENISPFPAIGLTVTALSCNVESSGSMGLIFFAGFSVPTGAFNAMTPPADTEAGCSDAGITSGTATLDGFRSRIFSATPATTGDKTGTLTSGSVSSWVAHMVVVSPF